MSKHYYYHEFSDKYFDDYDECRDDLFNFINSLTISNWIEENYSRNDLANFILDLAESNHPQREIERFLDRIYEAIEQESIFEGETSETDEKGKCFSCAFKSNCSHKNIEITNCRKWAWLSWDNKDPFAKE